AKNGNTKLVSYLRQSKHDAKINQSGPINEHCALLAAAKLGHFDTVSALMKSIPYGLRIGYHSVSRRQQDYPDQKTPLHYMAMYGTPQAFCDVLYGGGMRSTPSKVAMMKDIYGKSPITYLIEFNRLDILQEIIERGKGARKGYIYNSDYHFATLFGWRSDDEAFDDLELAKRINPQIYKFLCDHLSGRKTKKEKILSKVETEARQMSKSLATRSLQLTQDMAKRELSKLGVNEYDDWVIVEKENLENRKSTRQHAKEDLRSSVVRYALSKSHDDISRKSEDTLSPKSPNLRASK
ncbi:MAG: ankyrin repeat domain-containing protein, partial [Candidatus Berkiella sp.]